MSGNMIKIDGEDGLFEAYISKPQSGTGPAIVVIQEIFGVNQVMRDVCDWLASEGFVAICPDLFWRIEPGIQITDKTKEEWDRAFELYNLFDVEKGVEDISATVKYAAGLGQKVGTVGYCLGGYLSFLAGVRTAADASVCYYGIGIDNHLEEAEKCDTPIMLHIATEDGFVSKESQEKLKSGLTKPNYVLNWYQGRDHAFAREGGEHYDKDDAELANGRTLEFLREKLSA